MSYFKRKPFVLCHRDGASFSLGLCVCVTEGGPPTLPMRGTRQRPVSVGQIWHVVHFLSTHTHTHTHTPDPVNRTHRGTVSDRQQQTMKPRWDSHPPEGQYKGVSLSLTHTHTHTQPSPLPHKQHTLLQLLTFMNIVSLSLPLSEAQWSGVTHVWSRISRRFLSLSGETKLAFLRAPTRLYL